MLQYFCIRHIRNKRWVMSRDGPFFLKCFCGLRSHSSILPLHSYITFFCIPRFMLPYLKFCFASSKEEYFVLLNHMHIPKPGTLFCCPSPPPLTPINLSSRLVQPSICHEQIPTYLLADGQTSECMGGWKGGVEVNLGIMPSPPPAYWGFWGPWDLMKRGLPKMNINPFRPEKKNSPILAKIPPVL